MSRIVDISVRHAKTKVSAVSVQRVVHALDKLKGYRCPEGSLSIAFLGDKETAKLHDEFLGDPTVTDVITFEHGVTLATELRLYVAHGWLHLSGLRDGNRKESAAMRVGEAVAVSHLDKLGAKLRVRD